MYSRRSAWKDQPLRTRVVRGMEAGAILLVLWLSWGTAHAAPRTSPGDTVTLSFTATIQSGTVPGDVLFWLCADPQADGTGCFQMTTQSDGSYAYQLASATGTAYHKLEIAWTHGSQTGATTTPTASPSATAQPSALPVLPLHALCLYTQITVTGPKSFTCLVDANLITATPTPEVGAPTPTQLPTTSDPPPVDRDTATLITGLQIVIGVGLVLLVILVPILIWQRVSKRRK
jgi:hypothetical protein